MPPHARRYDSPAQENGFVRIKSNNGSHQKLFPCLAEQSCESEQHQFLKCPAKRTLPRTAYPKHLTPYL